MYNRREERNFKYNLKLILQTKSFLILFLSAFLSLKLYLLSLYQERGVSVISALCGGCYTSLLFWTWSKEKLLIIIQFFIMYVPQGQLQAQYSVDTSSYIMDNQNINSKTNYTQALGETKKQSNINGDNNFINTNLRREWSDPTC
jgi:hypothetical protein